jgi:multicomponent Na+:H+ antiporter subunit C
VIYSLCFVLVLVGLYGVLTRGNLIKIVVSMMVIEYGIHLLLALQGYRSGGVPPIVDQRSDHDLWLQSSVDPVPQALVLTSIVIGLGVLALMTALSMRIRERYKTYDIRKIRKLKG